MRVLALALGDRAGWACGDLDEAAPELGVLNLPSRADVGRALAEFQAALTGLIGRHRPQRLALQSAEPLDDSADIDRARFLIGMDGMARAVAYTAQVQSVSRPPSAMRRRVLGEASHARDTSRAAVVWCLMRQWRLPQHDPSCAVAAVAWHFEAILAGKVSGVMPKVIFPTSLSPP